ncbi:MAG TPA: xanthine dehydrogenase family protein subunit M [Dehalococcoidia bacterium]|nr:xanthine dehydrogenase family protein subunit M [Dehalococcoidia bacterium]
MQTFDYYAPSSLPEALDLLRQHGEDAKLIAGGTGLINMMKQNLVQPAVLVDMSKIPGLSYLEPNNGELRIGALTTHRQMETSPVVAQEAPLLAETYRHVATVRIRNVATVGGGVAHADPAQDPPPALLALDARVKAVSSSGERVIPISDFFVDYYETALSPDELVTEIIVPKPPVGAATCFFKFLPRSADDYATVSVAALLQVGQDGVCQDVRIGLGSVGSTPVRARQAEQVLRGQRLSLEAFQEAAARVKDEVDPISDVRGSAEYKRDMAEVFTRRALERCWTLAQARRGAR